MKIPPSEGVENFKGEILCWPKMEGNTCLKTWFNEGPRKCHFFIESFLDLLVMTMANRILHLDSSHQILNMNDLMSIKFKYLNPHRVI